MHIPDNYLSPQTCAVMAVAMVPVWAISVKKVKEEIPGESLPMLGACAAFSFLGMMFNIPMPGGTTGHAIGGTLIAALIGPYASCISISVALLLQALLFGDGGILAFGANSFNMAFVLPFVGYVVSSLLVKIYSAWNSRGLAKTKVSDGIHSISKKALFIFVGIGAYIGINASALAAAIEFGIQPMLFRSNNVAMYCPYGLNISIPAMCIGHLTVFGLAEVIFTLAVLGFMIGVAKSDLYLLGNRNEVSEKKGKAQSIVTKVLLVLLIVLTPLGLLAQGVAWGEWGIDEIAATGIGYTPKGMENGFSFASIFPDYSIGNMPEWIGYILSAVVGVSILIILFKVVAAASKKGK